jgi:hypothetical protein
VTRDAKTRSVLLIRPDQHDGSPALTVLNIDQYTSGADSSQNLLLQKGDLLFVPNTFIADVDRFFEHLKIIVSPLLDLERMVWIGQSISLKSDAGVSP